MYFDDILFKQIAFNLKSAKMWVFELTFWSSAAIFTKLYYLHKDWMVLTTLSHLWAPYFQLQNHLTYKQKKMATWKYGVVWIKSFQKMCFQAKISPNVSFLTCFFGLHQPSFPWKGVALLFYISNLKQNHQNFTNFRLKHALTCIVR